MNDVAGVVAHSLLAPGQNGAMTLVHDGAPPDVMRARISELVHTLMSLPGVITDFDDCTEHTIEDGMYMRKLFIPKGQLIVGKVHLKPCFNIVTSGDITVLTEYGVRRVTAGFVGVSQPGIQKVGIAHEDTVFINVFRTDLANVLDTDALEAAVAADEHTVADWNDYAAFLREYGLDAEQVKAVANDMSDHAPMPAYHAGTAVGPSAIHGTGVFATRSFAPGAVIGPARLGSRRTVLGRRVNHAKRPNCRFRSDAGGGLTLAASRDIAPGDELTLDYLQAAAANTALNLLPLEAA